MPESPKRALLIFIKNPEKGKVKTRLAETVGEAKALQIYNHLLDYTRRVALKISADKFLWYSQRVNKNDAWDDSSFIKRKQEGRSLGQRMKHAFKQTFDEGFQKAVIVGSDCAQLKPEHIEKAYLALEYHDVVIGPSQDGGYYLLGMSKFLADLFDDKSWSTDKVFEQSVQQCRDKEWHYHVLQELNDVDTEQDWQQVKDRF